MQFNILFLVQWIRDDIDKILLKRVTFFSVHIVLNDFKDKITLEIGLYSEGDDSMRLKESDFMKCLVI